MIKMKFSNQREIDRFLRGFDRAVQRGINNAFKDIGPDVVRAARRGITEGPKSGRVYHRRGRRHQSSAAGEFPANESGALRGSIDYEVQGSSRVRIGSTLQEIYPRVLEEGGGRIKARPYLKPAALGRARNATNYIGHHIVRELNRLGH